VVLSLLKTRDLTIYGVILGLYFAFSIIPFSFDLPVIDFILAYFRPYFRWKKTIALRLALLSIPFILRFSELWGMVLSIEIEGTSATFVLPLAFIMATGQHFAFLWYLDRFLSKKKVPFRN